MERRAVNGQSPQPDDHPAAPLDEWISLSGPVSPGLALVIALDACARASRMSGSELRDVARSLMVTRIFRSTAGRWVWTPVRVESSASSVSDTEVIERLGALLFHCLTGRAMIDPFADEHSVRTRLRTLRPDLPPGVADLTVRSITARRSGPWTLDAFATDVRQVLSIGSQIERPRSRRTVSALAAAMIAAALVLGAWWMSARSDDRVESHGLTRRETALVDVTEETAQGFAMMDEHTAALQEYQQLVRWLTPRLSPEDPRLAWNAAHEAWVRTLRGDRLTTEQVLGGDGATSRFEATLGDRHPYTRAARLELAATLAARGATSEAGALRDQADTAARALLVDTTSILSGVPAPPGVRAHLAPNPPASEGFRQSIDAGFFVPLTSIQRLFSGRDGWRLHVVASGNCRASVVVGNAPRLIVVTANQAEDKSWRIAIGGTAPAMDLHGRAGDTVALSLIADGSGAVGVRLAEEQPASAVIDTSAPPPTPPYSLAFSGGTDGSGCDLVWLEIPFPFEPTS
jgi:hypothetical protein